MPKFLEQLAKIAPSIASCFGTPLAGMATQFVVNALGLTGDTASPEGIAKLVASGQLTGEQISALKQAEMSLQVKMKELDISLDQMAATDRASARSMQTATGSKIPGSLAFVITIGYFGILFGMLFGDITVKENPALLLLLGALTTAWVSVVTFYFGSSSGSQAKDATIAQFKLN